MTDMELEAWYRRILAFERFRRTRQGRSAALARAVAAALGLTATFSASAAVAVQEGAKRDREATDG